MPQVVKLTQTAQTQTISINQGTLSKPETTFDITPGAAEQTVAPPVGYVFSGGTVGAIPSNYGLIAWDGSTLTVS